MAFKISFVPPKKVSFPEDPLPLKFFDDESHWGRTDGSFGSTAKARFKGDTVAIKEIIGNKWEETGKTFWKRQKYWKVSVTLI